MMSSIGITKTRRSLCAVLCVIALTSKLTMALSMSMTMKDYFSSTGQSNAVSNLEAATKTATTTTTTSHKNQSMMVESTTGSRPTRRSFLATSAAVASMVTLMTETSTPAYADGLPSQGAKAPEFELPNSRGTGLTSLQSLTKTGKWTVLYFYPGAFTTGCTLEARSFQKDLENYRKLNTQIVGVSVDPVEKNAQFCTEEQLDFILLSDKGGLVSKKYGSALSIPGFGTFSNRQTYIIDPKGELRWIFTDVESRIARHSSEVLDKLAELEGVAAV